MTGAESILRLAVPMMRGRTVRAVQAALVRRGLLPPSGVDGLFGPQTKRAVRAFQVAACLPATGTVDAATRSALFDLATHDRTHRTKPGRPHPVRAIVPQEDLPVAHPRRVVLHWTGGGANASAVDRQHYHFLVQQDGQVVKGSFSIADNDSTANGRYAAHTKHLNTRSVGIALCGMAGAHEVPFRAGKAPIRAAQLPVMAALVAQICKRYEIPVTRETILGHGEVQDILGVLQDAKWDPLVLPWRRELSKREVGDHMRALVLEALEGTSEGNDTEARPVDLDLLDTHIAGGAVASDGAITVPLDRLLDVLGWRLAQVEQEGVRLMAGDNPILVQLAPADKSPDEARIRTSGIAIEDLAEQLDLAVSVKEDGTGISLSKPRPDLRAATEGAQPLRPITVARGDTLSAIARREIGNAAAWRQILRLDGTRFDEASARRIVAGEQVLVPVADPSTKLSDDASPLEDSALDRIAEAISAETFAANRSAVKAHVPCILRACRRHGVTDPAHIAYILATAEHETNFGRQMTEIWGPSARQERYEANRSNEKPGDGKRFLGRGFVQLTFRENYRKFARALNVPLEDDPDRAADPDLAADILALGMSRVGYRSPRFVLKRYGFGSAFDFEQARAIVNADVNQFEERYDATIGVGVGRRARRYHRNLSLLLEGLRSE